MLAQPGERKQTDGARKKSVPGENPERMIEIANPITDDEMGAESDYFTDLKPRWAIRVVEAAEAP